MDIYRFGRFAKLTADISTYFVSGIDIDEDKLTKLKFPEPGNNFDVDNCQITFEALRGLSPSQAGDERLWAYLCHTSCIDYARARWPVPDDDLKAVSHIREHFFAGRIRDLERNNALSRMWWMAYLCSRLEDMALAEALSVLLYRADVRANIVERPTTSQSINVFAAIMRRLRSSFQEDRSLFERNRFRRMMMGLNGIGGYKLLDVLKAVQLDEILERVQRET